MIPREFFDIAKLLSGPSGPMPQGRQRSAISRCYYAAFLDARERLKAVPHITIPKKGAHDIVWKALSWADAPPLKSIGRLLQDLKKMREGADYDLLPDVSDEAVREAIRISEEIQQALATADMTRCVDPEARSR